ncbi:MAG: hypothetical protein R3345_12120, partial [Fulvivirga sp.]|nr:hypothetical protein [Fulvivirga sp.]
IAEDRRIMVFIEKYLPPQVKALEKIKGLVISDYQNYLEQEWIEQLKEKYTIKLRDEALQHVYKELINN